MISVAIHQPNFFPWLGYFNKLFLCDVFIFLDDVQFSKTGGTWSNRVKLLVSGESRWVTAAIDRNYSGERIIREMRFLAKSPWRQKFIKTLEANYRRHPYYIETMELVQPLILNPESNIAVYNMHAVVTIAENMGVNKNKFYYSSEYKAKGNSNELLCDLTLKAGGDIYLSGDGAGGYQQESTFENHNIQLEQQNFQHPKYIQHGREGFVPGLSVIDALMNLGISGTRQALKC